MQRQGNVPVLPNHYLQSLPNGHLAQLGPLVADATTATSTSILSHRAEDHILADKSGLQKAKETSTNSRPHELQRC